jgi:hypothetical protein
MAAGVLPSCKSHRVSTASVVTLTDRDSTATTTKTVTVYIRDTVTVMIPLQSSERTTSDSMSYLENDFACSLARINADGTFTHTLQTKSGNISIGFDKPVQTTETTTERIREIEKPVPVNVPIEVERKLTVWEKACIKSAPGLFIALLAALGYVFRKPLLAVARRFI